MSEEACNKIEGAIDRPQSPQMSDGQATDLTAVLAEALRTANFGPYRFIGGKDRYSHTQIRQLHTYISEGRVDLQPRELYSIKVRTDPSRLARLVNTLKAPLSPYFDEESGQVGFGQKKLTLDEFATATIRAAAIASPEQAIAAIQRWTAGEPWIETRTFTLTGITVQSRLDIATGVSLRRLPKQPHELRRHAPGLLVDEMERPGLLRSGAYLRGATVLCSEEYYRPVFWPAGQPPDRVEEIAFPGGIGGLFSLLRALSLVCNTYVESQYQWASGVPLLRAFVTDSGEGWGSSGPVDPPLTPPVPLTEPLLEEAICVSKKLQNAPKRVSNLVDRVFPRWMNCLRGRRPYDQLIEMRIALESLFAGQGQHNATLRVAYHGARYLGENPEARRCLFDDLKAIYSTASTLIHGGTPKHQRDLRALVQRAQCICRDAMLKMVSDSEIPDWTDLMLNGR